jgi:hypothetical protein
MKIFTAILTSFGLGFPIQIGYFYINTTTLQGQGLKSGEGLNSEPQNRRTAE